MADEFLYWVGIDWGCQTHEVCVLDGGGQVLLRRSVQHTGEALAGFADELVGLTKGEPTTVAASIETPRGAIIETLIERGVAAFSINPKQLSRFRDRYTIAGAKGDRRDAFVLADALRTDTALFRPVRPVDPRLVELGELVRVHDDLRQEVVALGNRLREQLHRFFPQVLELGSVYNRPWLWEVLQLAPQPQKAHCLKPVEVTAVLKRHKIRRLDGHQVIEKLCSKPLHVAPGVTEACGRHITMLLPRLRVAHTQRLQCEKEMEALLDKLSEPLIDDDGNVEPSDAAIVRSLPGVGTIVAATLLGEAARLLEERDLARLRFQCGTAPVTKQSGKSQVVVRRLACNPRLQQAMYHWSRVSTQHEQKSKEHYESLRAAGHRHGRALRGVADRLLTVLVAMLRDRKIYDPSRRDSRADQTKPEQPGVRGRTRPRGSNQ